MGKIKNKKREISDNISTRKSISKSKAINPFEVQINKEHFPVIGKISKNDKGLPGVSRAKAIAKRKATIGVEYLNRHKNNQFKDKRLMGGDEMSHEDVAIAKFTAERINQYQSKKNSIFNLNDDEVLTHKGQTLEEIEKFDDVDRSDDESDEEGRLGGLLIEFWV